jgi:hypothetical protein
VKRYVTRKHVIDSTADHAIFKFGSVAPHPNDSLLLVLWLYLSYFVPYADRHRSYILSIQQVGVKCPHHSLVYSAGSITGFSLDGQTASGSLYKLRTPMSVSYVTRATLNRNNFTSSGKTCRSLAPSRESGDQVRGYGNRLELSLSSRTSAWEDKIVMSDGE